MTTSCSIPKRVTSDFVGETPINWRNILHLSPLRRKPAISDSSEGLHYGSAPYLNSTFKRPHL